MQQVQEDFTQYSLDDLLKSQNIVLIEFLSIKNIHSKIKSRLKVFVSYCQKNQDFCYNLIDIGIKCPMHQGSSQLMKNACYIASDILTCDQDVIADLFILPSKQQMAANGNSSDQQNQIYENIVDQTQETTKPQQQQQDEFFKYKFLLRMLNYIQKDNQANIDQNCLNYLIKSMSCLLRKKIQEVFLLFKNKPQILNNLLELSHHASVNQFLIKFISQEEIEEEHKQVRNSIINNIVQKLKQSINQESLVYRLDFIDELFQANKYSSSNDTKSDLQIISDIFVSRDVIEFFMQFAINPKSFQQYYNSLSFLSLVIRRMNVDQEADPYNYNNQRKQPTMAFDVDIMFKNFGKIVKQFQKNAKHCKSDLEYKNKLLGNKFYQTLNLLCKNSRFSNQILDKEKGRIRKNTLVNDRISKIQILKSLINQFLGQNNNGINRYNILFIIQKALGLRIYEISTEDSEPIQCQKNQNIANDLCSSSQTQNSNQNMNSSEIQKSKIDQMKKKLQEFKEIKVQENQSKEPFDDSSKKRKMKFMNLKLNIKKKSEDETQLQHIQALKQRKQQSQNKKKQPQKNQLNQEIILKQKQIGLTKIEINQLLSHLHQKIQKSSIFEQIYQEKQKNVKNHNKIEWFSLLNKLILLICNSLSVIQVEKSCQQLKNQIQDDFPFLKIKEIQQTYSTRLATGKHPSGKIKLFSEFQFVQQSTNIFKKEQKSNQLQKSKNPISNMELSDGDFKSDEEQGPFIKATKCTLFDLKNINKQTQQKINQKVVQVQENKKQVVNHQIISQEVSTQNTQKVKSNENISALTEQKNRLNKQVKINKNNPQKITPTNIQSQKLRYYVKYLTLF